MANAPQSNGGGSAEGGYTGRLSFPYENSFGPEGPEANDKIPSPSVSNRDTGITNVVQTIDVTKVCNDMPGDGDYDDPYPTGTTKSKDFTPIIPLA